MLDVKNTSMREVMTPLGRGFLDGYDADTGKYHVRISRRDNQSIVGPCAFKFYSASELSEMKDGLPNNNK